MFEEIENGLILAFEAFNNNITLELKILNQEENEYTNNLLKFNLGHVPHIAHTIQEILLEPHALKFQGYWMNSIEDSVFLDNQIFLENIVPN